MIKHAYITYYYYYTSPHHRTMVRFAPRFGRFVERVLGLFGVRDFDMLNMREVGSQRRGFQKSNKITCWKTVITRNIFVSAGVCAKDAGQRPSKMLIYHVFRRVDLIRAIVCILALSFKSYSSVARCGLSCCLID